MSGWGPWHDEETRITHIVPCDSERNVLGEHIKSAACWCNPKPSTIQAYTLVHQDRERGGFNA